MLLKSTVWAYLHSFHMVVADSEAKNIINPTMSTNFSIKWHLKVIQGKTF